MKKLAQISVVLAALACLLLAGVAQAKRVGGGGSFGSRPSYSNTYSKPAAPAPAAPRQTAPQAAQPRPAAPPPPAAAPQPSMFSRLGWGMGGFLAGGLLGSMLFGQGGGFGGGMGGIGLLDMVLIGLVIFLAVKLLRRRTSAAQAQDGPGQPGQEPADIRSRAEQSWDSLRSSPDPQSATGVFGGAAVQAEPEAAPAVPEGFNVSEFLEGAKTVYARLQHSWDRRDLADIALFTTPEVLEEIRRQTLADPAPSKTELLLVNARLVEFREEAQHTIATVFFDVLLREDASEERPKQVREVWHFSRVTGSPDANWRLEGIQQLED